MKDLESKLTQLIETYLDEDGSGKTHMYETKQPKPVPLVTHVTTEDFKAKVLEDNSFEACLVEVLGNHCYACYRSDVYL
jgi:hypothetical protein